MNHDPLSDIREAADSYKTANETRTDALRALRNAVLAADETGTANRADIAAAARPHSTRLTYGWLTGNDHLKRIGQLLNAAGLPVAPASILGATLRLRLLMNGRVELSAEPVDDYDDPESFGRPARPEPSKDEQRTAVTTAWSKAVGILRKEGYALQESLDHESGWNVAVITPPTK